MRHGLQLRRSTLRPRTLAPSKRNAEAGASLVEFGLLLPLLIMLMVGTIDIGRLACIALEVHSAARAGVQYGSQNPATASDFAGMTSAAKTDVPDLTLSATPSNFCVCSGTTITSANKTSCTTPPTCTGVSLDEYVEVDTSSTYTPTFTYPGLPASFNVKSSAITRVGK